MNGEILVVIIFVILAALLIATLISSTEGKENHELSAEEQKALNEKGLATLTAYTSMNRLPIYQGEAPVMLRADEYPIVCSEAELAEERSIGNYSGMSFRVASGMYYRTGQSIGSARVTIIDSGQLVLTSKRLVFVGSKRTSSADLKRLVNVQLFSDAITVNKEGKAKAETYFTEAPIVYKVILELLHRFTFHKEGPDYLRADSSIEES